MKHRVTFAGGVGAAAFVALSLFAASAAAQEPAACLSPDPSQWPDPSRPYFLLAVDTSGSMIGCTNPSTSTYQFPNSCPSTAPQNSCGMEPTRINDAKCALRNTVLAFSGEVNFGLLTFPVRLSNCLAGQCADTCTLASGSCSPPSGVGTVGEFYRNSGCSVQAFLDPAADPSCGNTPDCATTPPAAPNLPEDWRNGGNVVVPLLQDPTWGPTPPASNTGELLKWFDGRCDESKELFAIGLTPLEGILRTAQQYLASGWNSGWRNGNYCPTLTFTDPTPIDSRDRPCRSINIILVTDGDETCNGTATSPATQLFNGITIGANRYQVRTHVIGFAGATQSNVDAIANAGGTTRALSANNESDLSRALANIIAGAIKPEICNNGDDNCNGCTDEGYTHYCNTRTPCCAWTTQAQRLSCTNTFLSTNNPADLPCTTEAQRTQPANWLCYDPGEICDDKDNNCNGQIDEGIRKCGTPEACPVAETCNGKDDDCDAVVDNASGSGAPFTACPNQCVPSTEVCDGCDNDCDGIADDNIPPIDCGFSPPANCQGQATCAPKTVTGPGACAAGGNTFGTCVNSPATEVCDDLDNDCDGIVNDGVPPTPCEIPDQTGLVYKDTFDKSQCEKGQQPCRGSCGGWVGPTPEVCDGIDNDCDGTVDDGVTGLGQICGTDVGPCSKGTTACVGGQVICTGGNQPDPEVCDGIDNDCNGATDDSLTVKPADPGCWALPATGCTTPCSYQNAQWCPPPGGACSANGTLAAPCKPGGLVCDGANGWKCVGGITPQQEVCDSVDNDCDGQLNETADLGPPVGTDCGLDIGECSFGKLICVDGALKCDGGQGPVPETCNGLDDNCDGRVDDGVSTGGACQPPYDTVTYPGDRTKGLCLPGIRECPTGEGPKCTGGKGPAPEVCDGKDNDCDGTIDEEGTPDDGIDGTADPLDSTRVLGEQCGLSIGTCLPGKWGCVNGRFECVDARGPQPEKCDCLDNDCDGTADEDPDSAQNQEELCTAGKLCVKSGSLCQCSKPCESGEFPCAAPTECRDVVMSSSGLPPPDTTKYCIDPTPCGDCKTVTREENGRVECAPAGTVLDGGATPPVCVCTGFGTDACRSPCHGISCPAGLACSMVGPEPGKCQDQNDCTFFPCAAGTICLNKVCIDHPCEPNSCPVDMVCKPDDPDTLQGSRCVNSCASVTCPTDQKCVDGACVAEACPGGCPAGEVCRSPAGQTPFCWPDECASGQVTCQPGKLCDDQTGTCINDPCTAVVCPANQVCQNGECAWAPETGSDAGGGGSGGSAVDAGTDAGAGTGGEPVEEKPRGVWGLASGGGCSCRTPPAERIPPNTLLLLAAAALVRLRRRGAR